MAQVEQRAAPGGRVQVADVPAVGERRRPVASLIRLTRSATRRWVVVGAAAQGEPAVAQPALDVLEPPGAEQLLQQLVPLLGARPQEGLEPALRQHRDLGELGDVHADQPA